MPALAGIPGAGPEEQRPGRDIRLGRHSSQPAGVTPRAGPAQAHPASPRPARPLGQAGSRASRLPCSPRSSIERPGGPIVAPVAPRAGAGISIQEGSTPTSASSHRYYKKLRPLPWILSRGRTATKITWLQCPGARDKTTRQD
jgi:hypothetical protein